MAGEDGSPPVVLGEEGSLLVVLGDDGSPPVVLGLEAPPPLVFGADGSPPVVLGLDPPSPLVPGVPLPLKKLLLEAGPVANEDTEALPFPPLDGLLGGVLGELPGSPPVPVGTLEGLYPPYPYP